jgi:hypothetical protein
MGGDRWKEGEPEEALWAFCGLELRPGSPWEISPLSVQASVSPSVKCHGTVVVRKSKLAARGSPTVLYGQCSGFSILDSVADT